jgi:hypothetical protein
MTCCGPFKQQMGWRGRVDVGGGQRSGYGEGGLEWRWGGGLDPDGRWTPVPSQSLSG